MELHVDLKFLVSLQLGQAGFMFVEVGSSQESFLKSYLTYLDGGLVLKSVKKNEFDDSYQDPSWYIYGGHDGAVFVFLKFGTGYVLEEAQVLFDYGLKKELVVYSQGGIAIKSSQSEKLAQDKNFDYLKNLL